jgi:hypothetical protein
MNYLLLQYAYDAYASTDRLSSSAVEGAAEPSSPWQMGTLTLVPRRSGQTSAESTANLDIFSPLRNALHM